MTACTTTTSMHARAHQENDYAEGWPDSYVSAEVRSDQRKDKCWDCHTNTPLLIRYGPMLRCKCIIKNILIYH